jgi:diguanylate cyclase (GGDEF)-like protein
MAAAQLAPRPLVAAWRAFGPPPTWKIWGQKEPLRSYALAVIVIGTVGTAYFLTRVSWQLHHVAVFGVLLGCALAATESTARIREVHGIVGQDLHGIWYLAAAISLPPGLVMLMPALVACHRLWRVRSGIIHRRVFSSANYAIVYGAAALAWHHVPATVAGPRPGTGSHVLAWAATVLAFSAGSLEIVDLGNFAAVKLYDRAASLRNELWNREVIAWNLLEVCMATTVALVAVIHPALIVLALPPVVMCRTHVMRTQFLSRQRVDSGTGLFTTRTWLREAETALLHAARSGSPAAVAMVGIDDFASTTGQAGDDVAQQLRREVAGVLREQLRDQDLIGNFGASEFVILFPDTGPSGAQALAGRLRDRVGGETFSIESGASFVFRVTLSIGIAAMSRPDKGKPLAELVTAAEAALGTARRTGWNKVYLQEELVHAAS